ncbi:MAG: hypothetical protein ABH864_02495 [archaeon]
MEISYYASESGKDLRRGQELFSVSGENLYVPRVGDTLPYYGVTEDPLEDPLSGLYEVGMVHLFYHGFTRQRGIDAIESEVPLKVGEGRGECEQSIICGVKRIEGLSRNK